MNNETIAMCMVKQLYTDKVIDDKTYEAVCKKHNSIFAQNKHSVFLNKNDKIQSELSYTDKTAS